MAKGKKMDVSIFNQLNQTFIINVSIGVIIGITLAPAVTSIAGGILKLVSRPLLRIIAPLEFKAFFIPKGMGIEDRVLPTSYQLPWGPAFGFGTTSMNIPFEIFPEVRFRGLDLAKYGKRFPYEFARWLYPPDHLSFEVLLESDNLTVLEIPLPGTPTRYPLPDGDIEPNVLYHRSLHVRPNKFFEEQRITVRVYYEGEPRDIPLNVTLPAPKSVTEHKDPEAPASPIQQKAADVVPEKKVEAK